MSVTWACRMRLADKPSACMVKKRLEHHGRGRLGIIEVGREVLGGSGETKVGEVAPDCRDVSCWQGSGSRGQEPLRVHRFACIAVRTGFTYCEPDPVPWTLL